MADSDTLIAALLAYDGERADRAIETMLALRSVERAVEEVLLPGLETIVGRMGADSAAWAFSARWAADWLRRAKRLAPPPLGSTSIVLVNASRDELDLDAAYIRALKVFCLRAGIKVVILSVRAMNGIGDVASVHRPDLIVLAGQEMDETTIARWTNATARSIGPRPLALYRHTTDADPRHRPPARTRRGTLAAARTRRRRPSRTPPSASELTVTRHAHPPSTEDSQANSSSRALQRHSRGSAGDERRTSVNGS